MWHLKQSVASRSVPAAIVCFVKLAEVGVAQNAGFDESLAPQAPWSAGPATLPLVALPVTRVLPDVAFASCGSWQSMQFAWRWPVPAVTPRALPKVAFANSAAVS